MQKIDLSTLMLKLKALAALALMVVLSACSSTVKDLSEGPSYKYNGEKFTNITVVDSGAIINDEGAFNKKTLEKSIQEALVKASLVDEKSDLSVLVDMKNVNIRSQGAAMVLGFLAGSDSLEGTVSLVKPDGSLLDKFGIKASYSAGGLIGGLDSARMDWLYDQFAKLTAENIKN